MDYISFSSFSYPIFSHISIIAEEFLYLSYIFRIKILIFPIFLSLASGTPVIVIPLTDGPLVGKLLEKPHKAVMLVHNLHHLYLNPRLETGDDRQSLTGIIYKAIGFINRDFIKRRLSRPSA